MSLFWLFWIPLAILVGTIASSRGRSGFGFFLLSLVMSPLISFAILLALSNKSEEARQEQFRKEEHQRQLESIRALAAAVAPSEAASSSPSASSSIAISEELEKLASLRDRGILTDTEFQQQKSLILNQRTTRG
jgi:hypothetical protein